MSRFRDKLSPSSVIYLLLHIVLVLLGLLTVKWWPGALGSGIGGSLIAAGLTGWVVYVYLLMSERRARLFDAMVKFGLIDLFEARGVRIKAEYDSRLARAGRQIDILGFGLKALREDYRQDFDSWRRRANVRILLIDPEFPRSTLSYARQRDREESDTEGSIRTSVESFVRETQSLCSTDVGHSFEVRLYTCLPSVNIFRIDDELFWGPYLIGEQSRNFPTFLVQKGGLLFNILVQHFDRIWNDSQLSRAPNRKEDAQKDS